MRLYNLGKIVSVELVKPKIHWFYKYLKDTDEIHGAGDKIKAEDFTRRQYHCFIKDGKVFTESAIMCYFEDGVCGVKYFYDMSYAKQYLSFLSKYISENKLECFDELNLNTDKK